MTHSKQSEQSELDEIVKDLPGASPSIDAGCYDLNHVMYACEYCGGNPRDKAKRAIEAYAQQEINRVLSELKEKLPRKYTDADKKMLLGKLPSEMEGILSDAELNSMIIGGMQSHNIAIDSAVSAIESYVKGDLKS